MLSLDRVPSRVQGTLCAVVLLVAVAACYPVAEIGIYDDWSYVRTAQLLALTGHIHYNGWATAMLGWQLFPAAASIWLFGFSFTVARMTTVLVSALTVFAMHRCFARCGLRARNASIAVLAVALSPLFLPLATTYMSDMYGLLPIVACLYCCIRATDGISARPWLWLVAASGVDVVGGTARQIAWLGLLVMVPSATWLLRRRKGVLLTGVVCWLLGTAAIAGCMRWFHQQPYAVPETFPDTRITGTVAATLGVNMLRIALETGMLLLPLLLGFFPALWRNRRTALSTLGAGFACVCLAVAAHHFTHHLAKFLVPTLLDGGNFVSVEGLLDAWPELGGRPTLLPDTVRAGLTLVVALGVVAVALTTYSARTLPGTDAPGSRMTWGRLLMLTVPFGVGYALLLVPRAAFFHPYDRYCLPLLALGAPLLVRFYEDTHGRSVSRAAVVAVAAIGVYSVCVTHDAFAMYRGTRLAIQEVAASGVPLTAIGAGWDFSGWTQITQDGFVHDPRLHLKGGEATPTVPENRPCPFEEQYLFPAVKPRYTLAFEPDLCGGNAPFAPVSFHTWLPWRTQAIYVVRNEPVKSGAQRP